MQSLNFRQRLFVEFYLGESSRSAVDAARRAGYRRPEEFGPWLLEVSAVQAAIAAGGESPAMASDEVLARLADIAAIDVFDFLRVDQDGGCKVDLKRIQRLGLRDLVKRLRINKDGTQDIDLFFNWPACWSSV